MTEREGMPLTLLTFVVYPLIGIAIALIAVVVVSLDTRGALMLSIAAFSLSAGLAGTKAAARGKDGGWWALASGIVALALYGAVVIPMVG
jgi:hypothetical protein